MTILADWIQDRLQSKPFASERWFVKPDGQVATSAY